ncbi:hypothetical protein B0T14DRAFT_554010 [Immersiella caudata]|uniref:Uncharacterized protein n=1 Tax=Immersiella caudata TaxID=314043 RepID=A0AA40C4I0_9PEZI|nr:hypothetical protein B0T14DRAFT_554010 [Immersiella caudata]
MKFAPSQSSLASATSGITHAPPRLLSRLGRSPPAAEAVSTCALIARTTVSIRPQVARMPRPSTSASGPKPQTVQAMPWAPPLGPALPDWVYSFVSLLPEVSFGLADRHTVRRGEFICS